jgi:hypothetical protein
MASRKFLARPSSRYRMFGVDCLFEIQVVEVHVVLLYYSYRPVLTVDQAYHLSRLERVYF